MSAYASRCANSMASKPLAASCGARPASLSNISITSCVDGSSSTRRIEATAVHTADTHLARLVQDARRVGQPGRVRRAGLNAGRRRDDASPSAERCCLVPRRCRCRPYTHQPARYAASARGPYRCPAVPRPTRVARRARRSVRRKRLEQRLLLRSGETAAGVVQQSAPHSCPRRPRRGSRAVRSRRARCSGRRCRGS